MSFVRMLAMIVVSIVLAGGSLDASTWLSSLETAKSQAASQGRPILAYFTGSDWSTECQSFKARILDSTEFREYAAAQLVLLEVDFPRARPMALMHKQANERLQKKYQVFTYPSLILLKANGDPVGNVQGNGNPVQMVATLEQTIARLQGRSPRATTAASAPPPPTPAAPAPVRELPLFSGATTQPLPAYSNLVVKSISGTPNKRFALINSATVAPGESVSLKLGERRVSLQCLEIREKSVIVKVDGEADQRELLLSHIRP